LSSKEVVFFLAKTSQKKVTISFEHKGAIWLPYREAHKMATFQTARDILKNAEKFLAKK